MSLRQHELTRYFYSHVERPDDVLTLQLLTGANLIDRLVPGRLKEHERDALVCLASDIIVGLADSPSARFEDSFLHTCLRKGMLQVAAGEFHNFCFVKKQYSHKAFQKRRTEHYLFTTGHMLFD